ncbi:MAG: glycosyltransferase [Actinomycetota bacterium]|nr:glycosyltransferase [Actinomycetota bacterium]
MARVLVLTSDVLPLGGRAASGAALRAWGIGEALRECGHDVEFAMPKDHARRVGADGQGIRFFEQLRLDAFLDAVDPDIAVFQHWPLVGALRREHRASIVIDFHGPLLLETLFRDAGSVRPLVGLKLRALARADYFTCASSSQLHYYAAYLLLAGFDLHELPIAVMPFSMPPALPDHHEWPAPPVFVYGGIFLPWQDPRTGLRVLVERLERAGAGELKMFGGRHPWMKLGSEERFEELRRMLDESERVTFTPMLPRTALVEEYTRASVAWDVMARNLERELAFTSRTVEYLWCGLPVVYNDYAELAEYIEEADAGWTVDPEDEGAISAVVDEILREPETVRRKGENARRLARERLAWDRTIRPLAEFCNGPRPPARLAPAPLVGGLKAEVVGLAKLARIAVPTLAKRRLERLVARVTPPNAAATRRDEP